MLQVEVSHKSEMAGPFNRGDTIINKHFYILVDLWHEFQVDMVQRRAKQLQYRLYLPV